MKSAFSCYTLNGNNSVTGSVVIKQVGGGNIASRSVVSGTGYVLGSGSLVSDATYQTVVTITDTLGSVTTYTGEINSAAYIMHIKKGGKAVGFGMAAGEDETVSFGWPIKLTAPLEIEQGGTGASTAANACAALGAVKKTGDTMTGNLSISSSQSLGDASDGIRRSPRGETATDPTFGPSGRQERLNCWLKNLR